MDKTMEVLEELCKEWFEKEEQVSLLRSDFSLPVDERPTEEDEEFATDMAWATRTVLEYVKARMKEK